MTIRTLILLLGALCVLGTAAAEPTYAERLGWPADAKVVIFHVDDAGMSYSSNVGTLKAMTEGLATSCSIMMPCSWVPHFKHLMDENPNLDAGVHLTLTSEWEHYRWGPVAGKAQTPGLVDAEGCMWDSVEEVVTNASPDEVDKEIRAQIDRAEAMGISITHLDSHMGTLFANPFFTARYVQAGIEKGIPVLMPGGHLQYISQESDLPTALIQRTAAKLWEAGLPVIDDVFAATYDWKKEDKTAKFIEILGGMEPGILEVILHCTEPSDVFAHISTSSETRKGDLNAMLDPKLEAFIEEEGIILTTWRELKTRRDGLPK